ncbi:MAG: D-amino-acid transaminase [Alphaproteobacteria bacterium]|nr:D-amino-acid transaminase [Alphaproteobacteria bacterium]
MTRIAYVNGRFKPFHEAAVHVEERGFQFADSVYEVIALVKGKLVDTEPHLNRLVDSAKEIRLPMPCSPIILEQHIHELVRLNRYQSGMVYIQVSRGAAPRIHPFPKNPTPSLVITVRPTNQLAFLEANKNGVTVITKEDTRWARPDIKTVNLLANILEKDNALQQGAYETVFIKNGYVTEATTANFWCVFGKTVCTHPKSQHILNGITKQRMQALGKDMGITIEERPFTLEEAYTADEAFLTSSNAFGLPVIQINDHKIGTGTSGRFTLALQKAFIEYIQGL